LTDTVSLTIDGHSVTVPKGTMIVEAANQLGIEIPVFCYHGKLEPVGMCRMCLVEVGTPSRNRATGELDLDDAGNPVIRFLPKPMTACSTPVSEGMVVKVDSESALEDRQAILEFLLTSHPLDCPICDKGGECPLQDLTVRHGAGNTRFDYEDKQHFPKKYPLGDLIVLDMERCIMCTRCVRFQEEIAFDPVLAVEQRGRNAHIVSYSNPKFDSHYSGNTADICPVGALTTRDFRFGARAWELTNVPSLCNHCGVGCNTVLGTRTGQIKRVMPRQNEAVNEIWICDKGRFGHHFNGSDRRLTNPLVRKDGELVETSWGEALKLVAEKLLSIKATAGANAIGGIAGARLSNEDLYLFQKLFRQVVGTHNIDHRVGLGAMVQDESACTVGVGCGTDLGQVGNNTTVLVLGTDLDEEAPVLYLRVATAAVRRGATLINAGGRKTKLDAQAQTTLRYKYGSAAHLVWAMIASVFKQELVNQSFVDEHTLEFAAFKQAAATLNLPELAEICGIAVDQIDAAAKAFANAENGLILFGAEAGNDPALSAGIEAFALLTGHAGRVNNGVIAVLPHANSRGAADMGVVPDKLPGYIPLDSDAVGLSADQMLSDESGLKGLLLAGADPAVESARYKAALEAVEFLVVQELFLTESAKLADVVLPVRGTAERDGTFTNLERRVQAFDTALPAPGAAWADWLVLTGIAGAMGTDWGHASADGVMAEITREVPLYAGMDFGNLTAPISLERKTAHYIYEGMSFTADVREGIQWQTMAEDANKPVPLRFIQPAQLSSAEPEEMTLVAPRVLYDDGRLLQEAEVVKAHIHPSALTISRKDAQALGLAAGDLVKISQNGNTVEVPVQPSRKVSEGVIILPRNLAGRPAEQLVGQDGHYTTVKVEKI
jgi:NADH-quinone oxidoreductase subunit G